MCCHLSHTRILDIVTYPERDSFDLVMVMDECSLIDVPRVMPVMAAALEQPSQQAFDPDDMSCTAWDLTVAYSLPSCSLCTLFEAIRKKTSEFTSEIKGRVLIQLADMLKALHQPIDGISRAMARALTLATSHDSVTFDFGLAHLRLNSASIFVCAMPCHAMPCHVMPWLVTCLTLHMDGWLA